MNKMFAEVIKVDVRLHKVLAAIFLLLLVTMNFLHAQPTVEHYVKSLVMWQIADIHVTWPRETEMARQDKPFVIGIVGENSFGRYLEQFYSRKQQPMKINEKSVVLRSIKQLEHISGCHLLFFIENLPSRFFARIMENIQDKPILTIAATEDYTKQGIHITFMVETTSSRPVVGLAINETAARTSGLVISRELLNQAKTLIKPYRPYEIIANYIERFTLFVEWPPVPEWLALSKPFKIQVLGQNFFGSYLDKAFERKKVENKPVVIRYISDIKEIKNPHLLFISKSMKNKIPEIIAYTKNKPILTIGNTRGFRQAGVHINFFYKRLLINFEINDDAVDAAGLSFSYHLSKSAKIDTSQ